jgi:hypothetical protein
MNTTPTDLRFLTLAQAQAELNTHPELRSARKRPTEVQVHFAQQPQTIATLEGPVPAKVGDAVITGTQGEQWPVQAALFATKYEAVPPTPFGSDGRYRSQARTVRALPLAQATQVQINTQGHQLNGQAGDWLVDYGDGSLGVVAAAVFERTYELMN